MSGPLQFLIKSAFDATGITAATNSINRIDSQITRVSRGLSKFTGLLAGGTAGMAALSFLNKTYDAYRESEKAVNLFAKAYQNLGNFTRKDIQDQVDLADKLQKTTKYTDEQILAIQTQLVTFGLYGEELKKATVATLDLAVKTGSSESAAKLMGKAYQGQTDTLAKYGIKIDANIKGHAKYEAVLSQVESRLGGLANTEGAALGATDQLYKSMDTLYEKIGELVSGPLTDVANILIDIVEIIPVATRAVYDGNVALQKTDGTLKTIFKSVWNNINIFRVLGGAATEATKAIMGVKPIPEDLGGGDPGKPTLSTPGGKDEDWEKFMSPEQQAKRLEAVMTDQRKQLELLRDFDGFKLTERGQMYTRFFGKTAIESRRNFIAQARNSEDMKIRQEKVLKDLERDYAEASHTFSGGFKQAMDETAQGMNNWKDNWNQVISGSIGPAKTAFHDFFTSSSQDFLNLEALSKKMFQGILNSFLEMIEIMIAKKAILLAFSGGAGLLPGVGKFFGFAGGGYTGDGNVNEVAGVVHRGEFVLSADVVKAIKSGSPVLNLSGGALASAGAGTNINYSSTININGGVNGGNVRDICRQIADAGRKGVTEALDLSKVIYKQGAKRVGETAL